MRRCSRCAPSAWLVSGVGLVAMLLAAIGLYGVIAYSVARRTREIGIRIALGAQPGAVVGLVMRQGLLVALVGLIAGCLLAAVAARAIAGALYGVSSADPVSWLTRRGRPAGGVGVRQPHPGLARRRTSIRCRSALRRPNSTCLRRRHALNMPEPTAPSKGCMSSDIRVGLRLLVEGQGVHADGGVDAGACASAPTRRSFRSSTTCCCGRCRCPSPTRSC